MLYLITEIVNTLVMKLHIIQAEYGDCLILESGVGTNLTTVLIDGGPYQTFEKHLKPTLQKLPIKGKLDLVVLSHIDNDHIIGLCDLLEEIKTKREEGTKELVKISKLWHNSFNDLLQTNQDPNTFLKRSLLTLNFKSNEEQKKMENSLTSVIMKGFQQATDLTSSAISLKIPINTEFDKLIQVGTIPKLIKSKDITFRILGPTKKNLEKLREEWKDWLNKRKLNQNIQFELFQILDKSIPNLSSIILLAEANNKKILFTGDGLGDDIVETLTSSAMLDKQGKFHVDILKVPHHGSDRNVSLEFFNTVHGDYYVISANGRDDNPSIDTLKWIIESNNRGNKSKRIVFTNKTSNTEKILKEYSQEKYNYEPIFLGRKEDFLTLNI
jgi:beta-lactamase superfamily II metal-dependent hydrolase